MYYLKHKYSIKNDWYTLKKITKPVFAFRHWDNLVSFSNILLNLIQQEGSYWLGTPGKFTFLYGNKIYLSHKRLLYLAVWMLRLHPYSPGLKSNKVRGYQGMRGWNKVLVILTSLPILTVLTVLKTRLMIAKCQHSPKLILSCSLLSSFIYRCYQ